MDVEAQDDGIVAKIMVKLPTISTYPPEFMQLLKKLLSPQVEAGTKVVQVGSRIGVLAEQGDDLSSLELPSEDNPSPGSRPVNTQSVKKDTTSPPPEDRPTQVESSAKSTPDTSHKHATPKTPHMSSPSVSHLLNTHGITKDNISRISTTGPKGRLLKGDVLAFLGKIEKSWPKELESRIHKGEKLDLSNIKVAAPRKTEAPKKVEKKVELPKNAEVKLEVSFSEVLKVQSKLQGTSTMHTSVNFPDGSLTSQQQLSAFTSPSHPSSPKPPPKPTKTSLLYFSPPAHPISSTRSSAYLRHLLKLPVAPSVCRLQRSRQRHS